MVGSDAGIGELMPFFKSTVVSKRIKPFALFNRVAWREEILQDAMYVSDEGYVCGTSAITIAQSPSVLTAAQVNDNAEVV